MKKNNPLYLTEARKLKGIITVNFWHNYLPYQQFADNAKTPVIGAMAQDLSCIVHSFLAGNVAEEDVRNKFTYIMDLLDFYIISAA